MKRREIAAAAGCHGGGQLKLARQPDPVALTLHADRIAEFNAAHRLATADTEVLSGQFMQPDQRKLPGIPSARRRSLTSLHSSRLACSERHGSTPAPTLVE